MAYEKRLIVACFFLAFCSLSYEFLLAQMMSILGGHTVFFYCMTIGLYIFALGMGSLMPVEKRSEDAVQSRLYLVELLLCLLGGGAPFLMICVDYFVRQWEFAAGSFYLAVFPHAILVLIIGFLSGMEVPLLLRLGEIRDMKKLMTRLLAIDYIASFIGAIAFPLYLFPRYGVVRASIILCLINIAAMLVILPLSLKGWRLPITLFLLSVALVAFGQSDRLSDWLSGRLY